jgi:S1-C subfamily serine protease
MSSRSKLLLLLLLAGVASVVAYDVMRPPAPEAQPQQPAAPVPQRPVRRVLDKTPLLYPGEFLQNLASRIGSALVVAVPDLEPSTESVGGIRVDTEGHVLVPLPADVASWSVQAGNQLLGARLVGFDAIHGVALLRVAEWPAGGSFIDPAEFGQLVPGEPVVVLGTPAPGAGARFFTAPASPRALLGILEREVLEPGDIVVDLDGRLLAFAAGAAHGAVPLLAEQVDEIIRALKKEGVHRHPWTGLTLQNIDVSLRAHFPSGALAVVHVQPGSPAAAAGVRPGHTFHEVVVGERSATSVAGVEEMLEVGSEIRLVSSEARRPDAVFTIDDLQLPPEFTVGARSESGVKPEPSDIGVPVIVVPGGPAALRGLMTGDVVAAVDLQPIRTTTQLERALSVRSPTLLSVRRGRKWLFIAVPGREEAPAISVTRSPGPGV